MIAWGVSGDARRWVHITVFLFAALVLAVEDGNELYDVMHRLRHATIQTTERVYAYFDRV